MIKPRTNELNTIAEMNNKKRRILVFPKEKGFLFFVAADKRIHYFGEETRDQILVGDIYVGKISNISENIGGIFVEVKKKVNCFLQAKEQENVIVLNRKPTGSLKAGDEIIVQIKKAAYKNKLAVCTSKLTGSEDMNSLIEKAKHSYPFTCLNKQSGALKEYINHFPLMEDEYILTEDKDLYQLLTEKYKVYASNIKLYNDATIRMSALYSMRKMIDDITLSKVWLASGGFLMIEATEAMLVIDVNTGKNQKGNDRESTILACNLEALDEILYQIKARNVSGIIIIDFINMKSETNRTILQQACKEKFQAQDSLLHYVEYTKLGLVEATRAKNNIDIYEFFRHNDKTILL